MFDDLFDDIIKETISKQPEPQEKNATPGPVTQRPRTTTPSPAVMTPEEQDEWDNNDEVWSTGPMEPWDNAGPDVWRTN